MLSSCSITDGGRTLVLIPDSFARQRTGDLCIDSRIEAYIAGMTCSEKLVVTASTGNEPVPTLRGGCAMQYAIFEEKPAVFEEFLTAGGKLRSCPGYPFGIYNGVTRICRAKPALAHSFFSAIGQNIGFRDSPDALMWHATLAKCVEGVQIALRNGAGVGRPEGDIRRISAGLPVSSLLEQTLLHGRPDDSVSMLAITNILIDAGASPWEVDADGVSLFVRAEKKLDDADNWAKLKTALLRARPQNAASGSGKPR